MENKEIAHELRQFAIRIAADTPLKSCRCSHCGFSDRLVPSRVTRIMKSKRGYVCDRCLANARRQRVSVKCQRVNIVLAVYGGIPEDPMVFPATPRGREQAELTYVEEANRMYGTAFTTGKEVESYRSDELQDNDNDIYLFLCVRVG